MKTIVALVGDYYHEASWAEAALRRAAAGLDATLRFASEKELAAELARKPDAVVLFKEDRAAPVENPDLRWMTGDVQRDIAQYVRDGGAWLGWHSGLASYAVSGEYVGMLRGYFEYHPNEHQVVSYETADNALGVALAEPFAIMDEHYFVKVDEANTHVFARSASVDGASIAGWAHEFGSGRVCCFTPAHRQEGLAHDAVVATLAALLRWCTNG